MLGCQDSNLGMAAPKAAALPLGYTPMSVKTVLECPIGKTGAAKSFYAAVHKIHSNPPESFEITEAVPSNRLEQCPVGLRYKKQSPTQKELGF